MSDLLSESLVPFYQAPAHVPGRPHISTLQRWRAKGLHGTKLETVLVGGRRFTSLEALERFFVGITATAAGELPNVRTARQRQHERDAANKRLQAAGILKMPAK